MNKRAQTHFAGGVLAMTLVVTLAGHAFSQDLTQSFSTAKETAQLNREQADYHRLLGKCPAEAQRAFLENFVLVNGRLGGTRVAEIKECLSAEEFNGLLTFFSAPTPMDHDAYRCGSRATCSKSPQEICTSNCRGLEADGPSANKDGFVSLRDLLKNCSQERRDGFSSSLRFEHGRLVGASYDLIASCSGEAGEVFRKYQSASK